MMQQDEPREPIDFDKLIREGQSAKLDNFAKVGEKGGPSATVVTKGEGKDEVVTEVKVTAGKKKKTNK